MKCRKCGASLPDNAIRCSNCGIKVNMYCPECKTLNPFGTKFCTNCGHVLIKFCPNCHSSNIYSAKECRKCKTPFPDSEIKVVNPISSIISEQTENADIVNPIYQQEETNTNNFAVEYEDSEPVFNIDSQDETNTQDKSVDYTENIEDGQEIAQVDDLKYISEEELSETDFIEPVENTDTADYSENIEDETSDFEKTNDIDVNEKEEDEIISDDNIQDNDIAIKIKKNQAEIQKEAVNKAIQTITKSLEKHIIAINGPEGCGKTAVIKQVSQKLDSENYITLYGNCTPLSQITSFGFFQDAFLRIMGFPPYINSYEAFIKDFKKSDYVNAFKFLNQEELNLFLNVLYPSVQDKFENILDNRNILFSVMEKVIKSFLVSSNVIIAIDNFELLDGASYDFIMHLLNQKFFNNRLKLLIAYQEDKSIQSYFEITQESYDLFETIKTEKFNDNELIEAVNASLDLNIEEVIPENYLSEILAKADGNAIRMEQEAALLFDSDYISAENNEICINEENKPEISSQSLEELIKQRINKLTPEAKNVLFMAAIMGYRFATHILCSSSAMPPKKAEKMLEFLNRELYINYVDNFTCEFKSLSIWKIIYQEAKADLLFKENSQRLYKTLKPLIISSNLQKLISCKEALSKQDEFMIWQITAGLTSKLGDTNLFVIAQKQSLKVLEAQELQNTEEIRCVIYEQLGKLLHQKSPTEAVTYLSNVLDAEIKAGNINKIIDVSGYFINSCYLSGNFFGAAEAVDSIISNLSKCDTKVSARDIALIKTRKLKALLNIGNCEQIINLIKDDILPDLERDEDKKNQASSVSKNILIDAQLICRTVLAKALALQGNSEAYIVLEDLKEFLSKNNFKSDFYKNQADLIEALADSLTGNIQISQEILDGLKEKHETNQMEPAILAEWNLINVINKIFSKQTKDLKEELFEIASFANNINEHFIKNIVKLILGYVLQEEGNIKKALEIFNEEITYFSKEKVAIGAMLSWALIVRISINSSDIDKALSTASKALEIAQSPKINNFFFIIYFEKFLAEIYMIKGDLIAVKMYLEKAVMLAKQQNLKYQLAILYLDYGKYMEEYMNENQSYTSENVKLTNDVYNKSVDIAKDLNIGCLIDETTRERSAFKTYCQLKAIEV